MDFHRICYVFHAFTLFFIDLNGRHRSCGPLGLALTIRCDAMGWSTMAATMR